MLEFLRPGYLWAGVLLALLPPLLHLIARRPLASAPLPTARLLRPDPRLAVRLQRRPTDVLLLLLRSALLFLIGAGAAEPIWSAPRSERLDLVLLDRSGDALDPWAEAVDSARALLLADAPGVRRELVIFDTAAVRVRPSLITAAFLDSIAAAGPGGAPPDYAVALRSIPEVARDADSVRVALVTRPRWTGWSPGLAHLRAAAWRGPIRVVEVREDVEGDASRAAERRGGSAGVVTSGAGGAYAVAALAALGWKVGPPATWPAAGNPGVFVGIAPLSNGAGNELLARARAGSVVILDGEAQRSLPDGALPWVTGSGSVARDTATGVLVLEDGTELAGAAGRLLATPHARSHILAAWEDGRPAAAAAQTGEGCLVVIGTRLEAGWLPLSPGYPRLLDRLVRGCEAEPGTGRRNDAPLDAGALAVLTARPGAAVPAAPARSNGAPLRRWFLIAALCLAVLETGIAYRGGRR